MRLCGLVLCVAMLIQFLGASVHAQLGDGECSVYLEPTQFHDFLLNDMGMFEVADFAIAAPYMSTSPVADGVLGDGEYANACFFTFAENENPGQSWPTLDNLDDGDPDLTATMHFAHTDEYLFVAFDVTDDYLDLDYPANSFQNDGVEIFFNPDLDLGDAWGPGKFQVYVDAAGDGDVEFNNRGATAGIIPVFDAPPLDGEFYSAGLVKEDESGYVVEFMIPLASLDTTGGDDDLTPVATGDFVLINTAIDDNDEDDDPTQQTGHHVMWHFDGASSPFGGGEDIWPVPLMLTPESATEPGDFNNDGVLDGQDIDDLTTQSASNTNPAAYDLNGDSLVNDGDINVWVRDLYGSWIGDADLDGQFSSADLVTVLASGLYEADADSVWTSGDFNGDGRSNSTDLVSALADGGYEAGPRPATAAVPEPGSLVLLALGAISLMVRRRQ